MVIEEDLGEIEERNERKILIIKGMIKKKDKVGYLEELEGMERNVLKVKIN